MAGDAAYVFAVTLELTPDDPDLRLDPAVVETTLFKEAAEPGEPGWRFFRDNLWRGAVNDPEYLRASAAERLGIEVRSIEFRELRTDGTYLDELKAAIGEDLDAFAADDVAEVLTKYLGSRIHVREP